jgi:hypothetical protein
VEVDQVSSSTWNPFGGGLAFPQLTIVLQGSGAEQPSCCGQLPSLNWPSSGASCCGCFV